MNFLILQNYLLTFMHFEEIMEILQVVSLIFKYTIYILLND